MKKLAVDILGAFALCGGIWCASAVFGLLFRLLGVA